MKIKEMEIKTLIYLSILIALSFIGSTIKIQGSIALDSLPGFFASIFISPIAGAIVTAIGHFITAFISGFPQTIIIHLILMISMGIISFLFGVMYKRVGGFISCLITIILNSFGMLLLLTPITKFLGLSLQGITFFYTLLIPLFIGSLINVLLAYILYKLLKGKI